MSGSKPSKRSKKKFSTFVACIVVETHEHYESETHKPIREYGWSAGIGLQTLPIPLANIKGQSRHSDPMDALANALAFMKRLGVCVISKAIPKVIE